MRMPLALSKNGATTKTITSDVMANTRQIRRNNNLQSIIIFFLIIFASYKKGFMCTNTVDFQLIGRNKVNYSFDLKGSSNFLEFMMYYNEKRNSNSEQ